MLRLVNPTLIQPEYFDPAIECGDKHRRKLLLITKVRAAALVAAQCNVFKWCIVFCLIVWYQIMQTLGNRGKFGAKESFMTVMIEHLEAQHCSSRLEAFLANILTVPVDFDLREEVPYGGFDKMLTENTLGIIRKFFCR